MSDNQQAHSLSRIPSRSVTIEVIDQLQEAIRLRVFSAGEQLPSEPKLAEQLGVSRNTLREAINSLIEKGILYRQRGVGTFVTAQPELMLKTNLEQVVGTSDLIREQGSTPGQKDFQWKIEKSSPDIAKNLQVKTGSMVIHVSRIRTADNVPVIQADEYIPLDILGEDHSFAKESISENWSIYNFLKEFGYEIHSAVTRVIAVTADEKMAKELRIIKGQPLLCLQQTHYSNNHLTPILYCVNFHNEKLIDVVVIRKG